MHKELLIKKKRKRENSSGFVQNIKNLLLKQKLIACKQQFKQIKSLDTKDDYKYKTLKDIVSIIEVNPKFNFEFLNILKENKTVYEEEGKIYNFQNNFDLLKYTLTSGDYFSLTNEIKENPLLELIKILKVLSNKEIVNYSQKINFFSLEYNYPFIEGILGLRIQYYINYILSMNDKDIFKSMREYLNLIHIDPEINNLNVDKRKFKLKLFLLIFHIADNISENKDYLNQYFLKDIKKEKIENSFYISKRKHGKYLVIRNKLSESLRINAKDYMLEKLINEIKMYPKYPLKLLLLRNESFHKFKKDKGFLREMGLYEHFIAHLKFFIKSNVVKSILSFHQYREIQKLLNNDDYINDIL